MDSLEAEILAGSRMLRVPGSGERRVLSPVAVARLAAAAGRPGWEVEAAALEAGIAPLHYLRNLARFGIAGQARLLRSTAALAGCAAVVSRALELLALNGVGRMVLLLSGAGAAPDGAGGLALAALNRNASCAVETRPLALDAGNPAETLRGADVVGACLDSSRGEQLLQAACRMIRAPLVLAGVDGSRGQATVVYPGDAGAARLYRGDRPHLPPDRKGADADPKAALVVGMWLADQLTRTLLDEQEILRGRVLHADLASGAMEEYLL